MSEYEVYKKTSAQRKFQFVADAGGPGILKLQPSVKLIWCIGVARATPGQQRAKLPPMTARILIVDDVPANTRLLEAKLSAEYYQVASAKDGFEALRMALDWQPDLILLDVMMPGMDGFECCRRLKDDPTTLHIPVVMVTALGEPGERLRGLESGADDFLTKPVEYETLMARVRSLVRLKRLLDEWRARGETARAHGPDQRERGAAIGCRRPRVGGR